MPARTPSTGGRKIDAAGPDFDRAAVGQPWRGQAFRGFLERAKPESAMGQFVVAALGNAVASALGARSKMVRLSGETAAKQRSRHADLHPADYARVQRILDEGEWFTQSGTHALGFLEEDGRWWRAAVKATADGTETYLKTLHRARPRDLRAARRRWDGIGG